MMAFPFPAPMPTQHVGLNLGELGIRRNGKTPKKVPFKCVKRLHVKSSNVLPLVTGLPVTQLCAMLYILLATTAVVWVRSNDIYILYI
jgi:hypothetical protein